MSCTEVTQDLEPGGSDFWLNVPIGIALLPLGTLPVGAVVVAVAAIAALAIPRRHVGSDGEAVRAAELEPAAA